MIRIWFNHWFRTAYSIVKLMRRDDTYIIGSHSVEYSPISTVCDEWYKEEYLPANEYVDFCVDFCRAHSVDVFVPHRHMTAIAENKSRFDEIGVKLLSDNGDLLSLFENKSKAYKLFENDKNVNIPEHRVVNTANEFAAAFRDMSEIYETLCVKFVKDEGAQSFRKIVKKADAFRALHYYSGFSATYEELYSALSERESFEDLLVMPYLNGCEVSVDCLKTDSGVLALPRFKGEAHIETLKFDEEILAMTNAVLAKVDLQYPCDIQFRYLNSTPYLLEVNTRMSGGLPMTCSAAGVNIPQLALSKLLGEPCVMPNISTDDKVFSNVEVPVIIK